MRPARFRRCAAAAAALLASGCAGVRVGRPILVSDSLSTFRVVEVKVRGDVVAYAEADGGIRPVDERLVVLREFRFDPDEATGADGALGGYLLLDTKTGETLPVRAPGFDPAFSVPAFRDRRMAYWAFRDPPRDYTVVAVRVFDLLSRRLLGESAIVPPLPARPTDVPYLPAPAWWIDDAVFRTEENRWIVSAPLR